MLFELILACRPAEIVPTDVRARTLDGMPTVIEVRWNTEEPAPGRVEFGVDGAIDRTTPETAPATEHLATLVGLPPDRDVSVRIPGAEPLVVRTGPLEGAPVLDVEGDNDRFAITTLLGERNVIVLLDPEGRVTWRYEDPRGLEAFRAMILRDGSGVAYLSSIVGGGPSPDSAIVEVGWDGVVRREIAVPDLAHDLVQLPDGTYVALAYETRDDVLGNALLAIDGDAVSPLWSSWDCFDPVAQPGDDPNQGWTHANALDYDPVEDVLLVGLRNLSTVAAIDRATGACRWSLGAEGDLALDGDAFLHQHQLDRTDQGLLVFDNDGAPGQVSRVVEYALDPESGTASVARTIVADPPLFSFILGDVRRLDDGDTLIAWGAAGKIDRVAPDGTRRWRADAGADTIIAFVRWQADPYVPEH